MREIKFRGRKSNGEWVYGDLITTETTGGIPTKKQILPFDAILFENTEEVEEDTIGRFTGLHDKNGKEIYFGVIVRSKYGDIGKVVWFPDCSIRVDWGAGDIHFIDPDLELEVIGNVYDNPELLNDKNE